jgi:hypothetical protein
LVGQKFTKHWIKFSWYYGRVGKNFTERNHMHMYQNQPQYNSGYYIPPQNSYMRTPLPQTPVMLKGRPVSSIEEVKASAIDFDGSVFYFPDVANKRIYTK